MAIDESTKIEVVDFGLLRPEEATAGTLPPEYPIFNDTGMFSGTCTLVCHGVDHNNLGYP